MECSRCAGPIAKAVQWVHGSGATDHETHALAVAATAVEVIAHEVDCPLGVMVLDEASRAPVSEPGAPLRRAAEAVLGGEAEVLHDGMLLDAAITCCLRRRDGQACPLSAWLPPSSGE